MSGGGAGERACQKNGGVGAERGAGSHGAVILQSGKRRGLMAAQNPFNSRSCHKSHSVIKCN